jgi:ligand-binding sensor domain-containing protein
MGRKLITVSVRALCGLTVVLAASIFGFSGSNAGSAGVAEPNFSPSGIALSPGRVWLGDLQANQVTELNSANGQLVRYISSSKVRNLESVDLQVSGSRLWVALPKSVAEFDASSGSLVRVIDNPSGDRGFTAGLAVQGSRVWVLTQGIPSSYLTEFNSSNGTLVRVLAVAGTADDFAVTKRHVWVTESSPGTWGIVEYNKVDGSVIRTITAAQNLGFQFPSVVTVSGNRLWTTNGQSPDIAELNTSDGSVIRRIQLPFVGIGHFSSLVVDGPNLFMSTQSSHGLVIEVNKSSGKVVHVYNIPARQDFLSPNHIAVSGNTLWLANGGEYLDEYSCSTGTLIRVLT